MSEKNMIFYISSLQEQLVCYSQNLSWIEAIYQHMGDGTYKLFAKSRKKFFKTFIDVEDKEIVYYRSQLMSRGEKDYLEALEWEEANGLKGTITYLEDLVSVYELTDKEKRRIKKTIEILKRIRKTKNNTEPVFFNKQMIEEFKKQDQFIKGIF